MPGTELFGAEERKEVNDVMESGVLFRYNHDDLRNGHWKAKEFEAEIAKWTGAKYAHTCSSGSTAVALSLAANGIGAGDHVIVPAFTYIATIEAVIAAGAIPVFAEMDETLCISPEGIEAAITDNTKAVLLVHMLGGMAKIEEIKTLCDKKGIKLIEDSAQALGAKFKGKAIGTFGTVGCYSFDFFKIITAGEGGAVITNDKQLYENADMFSDHGHDHIGDNRGMEQHPVLGHNFRISELHAAVGLAQVRKLDHILGNQKANKAKLDAVLDKFPQLERRHFPDPEGDSATFYCWFMKDEEEARSTIDTLKNHGIGAAYWYDNNFHYIKNWHHLKEKSTLFKSSINSEDLPQDYASLKLPKTDSILQRMICVQIKVTWSEDELNDFCSKLEAALTEVTA